MFYGTAKNNCQSTPSIDYSEAFRILNTTCVELAFLKLLIDTSRRKYPEIGLSPKGIIFVNAELELLNLTIRYLFLVSGRKVACRVEYLTSCCNQKQKKISKFTIDTQSPKDIEPKRVDGKPIFIIKL